MNKLLCMKPGTTRLIASNQTMLRPAASAAKEVARQLAADAPRYQGLAEALRINPPHGVVTIARGRPDHAASYLAHLVLSRTGQLVTALPLSLLTLYKAPVAPHGLLVIAFSQRGCDLDLVNSMRTFRRAGSSTVALVNECSAPMAKAVEWSLPLHAGTDETMLSTTGFICSLTAAARLSTHWPWGIHEDLQDALADLPDALEQACQQESSTAAETLVAARGLSIIGCGPGLAIAREAASAFQQICGIPAEAFSPVEMVGPNGIPTSNAHPLLVLAPRGPSQSGLIEWATEMRVCGARVLLAAPPDVRSRNLTLVHAPHRDLDPITAIQAIYALQQTVSLARGMV
jgi:glucosamine--fructose-6-phosphate aminotransferase (isomerizing)